MEITEGGPGSGECIFGFRVLGSIPSKHHFAKHFLCKKQVLGPCWGPGVERKLTQALTRQYQRCCSRKAPRELWGGSAPTDWEVKDRVMKEVGLNCILKDRKYFNIFNISIAKMQDDFKKRKII